MMNQRCWLFTEIADEKRITQGNAGYADETGVIYRYDNSVPNHKNPAEGDIVILRKGHEALGWALICGIKKDIGSKERRRCPECKKTKVRLRKTMSPQWWCTECRIDFEKPIISFEPAVLYEAHFNGTFNSLKKEIPLSTLWRHAKKINKQHSIQELDLQGIRTIIELPDKNDILKLATESKTEPDEGPPGELKFVSGHKRRSESAGNHQTSSKKFRNGVQHNRVQNALYDELVAKHGRENVQTEVSAGGKTKIDLVVRVKEGIHDFYEIKISTSVRTGIREAIGQILEYAYFHSNDDIVRNLVIVTPQPISDGCRNWIAKLQKIGLKIVHRHFVIN